MLLKLGHYENLPMQYTEKLSSIKNKKKFIGKTWLILMFAQNIDCGYTLEPPRRGDSNEYPQSTFWNKNKNNRYTPANPSFFFLYKSVVQGGIRFMDMFS